MNLSRRQILAGGAALALAPSLARGKAPELDVAIVGGGVSGTYAAWRLRQERPDLRIRLFEASDRIGGRLHSVAFPQAPHLVAEIGGMRFLEAHAHVFGLVKNLSLPKRLYPIDRDADRVMLRGRNFSRKDVDAGRARFPYRVPDKDQSPESDFFGRTIENILPGASHMTPAEWRKRRAAYRYKGRPLRDWKNRDMLRDAGMSAEELALVEDGSGYDDWIEGETGLDEMDYVFVHDDESKPFYTIAGGYQQLPLTLAAQARRAGANVSLQARLVGLIAEHGRFRLALRDASGRRSEISTGRVILALPRRGIESIENFPDAKSNSRFARLISSVTPIPACKSLLLYKRPWWRDHGIVEGRSVTDMPARQFYCLGSETTRLLSEDTNGYGVLMAYCDMKSVAVWRKLAGTNDGYVSLAGDSPLAREVHREAQRVIGRTDLQPIAARFEDWSASPFGGGWHYYALGHDGLADSVAMLKPMPERELFVCGEAWSTSQGWVEGALERAETMLERHFGLHRPDWLRA